jgi:hypothetical protein
MMCACFFLSDGKHDFQKDKKNNSPKTLPFFFLFIFYGGIFFFKSFKQLNRERQASLYLTVD